MSSEPTAAGGSSSYSSAGAQSGAGARSAAGSAAPNPCPICGGSTWVLGDDNEPVPCTCREGRLRRARTRGVLSTIPRKFRGIALSDDGRKIADSGRPLDFPPAIEREVLKYCRNIDKMLETGRGLWFEGEAGTGKTTLAMFVSRCAHDAGRSVAIYSMPRLLTEIRATFSADSPTAYKDLMDRLTAVDLLHIDDVGAEQQTEWVLEQFYAIVNSRYEDGQSIMITTNLEIDELRKQVSERTVSRLTEICQIFPLFGNDRRMEPRIISA